MLLRIRYVIFEFAELNHLTVVFPQHIGSFKGRELELNLAMFHPFYDSESHPKTTRNAERIVSIVGDILVSDKPPTD